MAQPRWFPDWKAWAVKCPTPELAREMHAAALAAPGLAATRPALRREIDLSPYDHAVVIKFDMTLATSEYQFETRADGVLPRSRLIVGKHTVLFKEHLKNHYNEQGLQIRYKDLVFNDGAVIKSGWVLPVAAETAAKGTLAAFLRAKGVTITEVDLDEGDDEDDDADRDDEALVDDEAEEVADEEGM